MQFEQIHIRTQEARWWRSEKMLQQVLKNGVRGGMSGLKSSRSLPGLITKPIKGLKQGVKRKVKQVLWKRSREKSQRQTHSFHSSTFEVRERTGSKRGIVVC